MTKTIETLEADARRANAALRAARRDKARRDREALLSAYAALGERLSTLAGADTAESVQALSERLSDDAIRDLIAQPAPAEVFEQGY